MPQIVTTSGWLLKQTDISLIGYNILTNKIPQINTEGNQVMGGSSKDTNNFLIGYNIYRPINYLRLILNRFKWWIVRINRITDWLLNIVKLNDFGSHFRTEIVK